MIENKLNRIPDVGVDETRESRSLCLPQIYCFDNRKSQTDSNRVIHQ